VRDGVDIIPVIRRGSYERGLKAMDHHYLLRYFLAFRRGFLCEDEAEA
jgi:hypothetical protein